MDNLIQIAVFLFVGLLLGVLSRSPVSDRVAIPGDFADALTTFVIFVSLPALIISRVPTLEVSGDLLVPIVLPWIMLVFSAAMVLMATAFFKWDDSVRGLLLLLVPLGNTSFLGIPMVQAFLGESGVAYALLYDQLGSFLALATYGTLITSFQQTSRVSPKTAGRELALRIVSFPPFLALLFALASRSFVFHPFAVRGLEVLSSTLVPLVMVAVGFRLTLHIPRSHRTPLAVGLALKLVLAPLVALGGCRLLGLEGEAVDVSIFESGMPPMVAAWALASRAGLHPELGAVMVGLGIVLSFITLPILAQLL